MDGENIGNINVSIGADYSPLKDAISESEQIATQGGKDIANALVAGGEAGGDLGATIAAQLSVIGPAADGAAASLDPFEAKVAELVGEGATLADAIAQASAALGTVGAPADEAAAAVTGLSDAEKEAIASALGLTDAEQPAAKATEEMGAAAGEAQAKLAEMAEKLAALAEALIITEAMKEFGIEAAAASDNITKADISLTRLTGDAELAKTSIEEIEKLGMADGLALPSLLQAATRMTALLPAGTDVVGLLKHIADGAAVMGTDIGAAATKFDTLATAGTASARTLTGLGISLQGLADAMNRTGVAEDATAAGAAKMFKALDESDRIKALTDALSQMGGTAEQVANQTFGGAWVQLANAWEQVMKQAGDALKPLVLDLAEFLKLDVLPFLKEMAEGFNELPEPVKNTAVALALVTAAVAPVLAGAAAFSLALSGLQGILPAVTSLLETFGVTASTVATEEGVATIATEDLAVAAGTATTAGAGLATMLSGVLVIAVTGAIISLSDLKDRLDAAHEGLEGLTKGEFDKWLQSAVTHLDKASISADDLDLKAGQLKTGLELGAISAKQYADAMDAIDKAQLRVSADSIQDYLKSIGDNLHIVADSGKKATDSLSLLKVAMDDATAAQVKAQDAYQKGQISADQMTAANTRLVTSQKAYNDALTAGKPDPYINGLKALATQAQITAAQEDVLANKFTLLQQSALLAGQKLFDLNEEAKTLEKGTRDGTVTEQAYIDKLREVATAADDYKRKSEDLNDAKNKAVPVTNALSDSEHQFGIQVITSNSSTKTLSNTVLEYGQILTTTLVPATKQAGDATAVQTSLVDKLADAYYSAGTAARNMANEAVQAIGILGDAQIKLNTATASYKPGQAPVFGIGNPIGDFYAANPNLAPKIDHSGDGAAATTLPTGPSSSGGAARTTAPAGGGSSASSASSGAESAANIQVLQASLNTANQLLTQAQFNYQNGSGTLDDFKSAQALAQVAQTAYDAAIKGKSGSTAAQVTSGSVDNASSGGSYPGVVIHQAAGEVLLVAAASGAQTISAGYGGSPVPVTGLADATAAQAASSTAQVVSTAADSMSSTVVLLEQLTGTIQTIYEAAANLHMKDVLVATPLTLPGTTTTAATPTSTTGTSGYGNSITGSWTNYPNGGLPTGGPIGYVQTVNPQTTSGSSGPSSVTANVDLSGSNFGAMSPSEVQGIVTQSLTRALRDSGGRF